MLNNNISTVSNEFELITAEEAASLSEAAESKITISTISLLIKHSANVGLKYVLYQGSVSLEIRELLTEKHYIVKDVNHCAIPGRLVLIQWK